MKFNLPLFIRPMSLREQAQSSLERIEARIFWTQIAAIEARHTLNCDREKKECILRFLNDTTE